MPPLPMMSSSMDPAPYKIVIRSLADFLWGVAEQKEEKYPSFGFSLDEKYDAGFKIKRVFPESIAEKQGLQKDDIIVAIDGIEFTDDIQIKKHLGAKNWNEIISFKIVRNNEEMEIKFNITSLTEK